MGAYGSLGGGLHPHAGTATARRKVEAAVLSIIDSASGSRATVFAHARGPDALDGTRREFATGYGGSPCATRCLRRASRFTHRSACSSRRRTRSRHEAGLGRRRLGRRRRRLASRDQRLEGYFVTQPDITLHANAKRWLRFGVTGGYRFASGVDAFGYDGKAMSGAVVGANVQLGWF